jgi:hypothetical protein
MTSVLVSLLATLRGVVHSRAALHLEFLALRHQVQVLQRSQRRRFRLAHADRWLWAWLSHVWRGWRTALVIVKPETVVAWHRKGFRLFWMWKSRRRTGRPRVSQGNYRKPQSIADPAGAIHSVVKTARTRICSSGPYVVFATGKRDRISRCPASRK